ncbi:MAG: GGDEF domain-containing protein [Gammaproteobacteria bacterium]
MSSTRPSESAYSIDTDFKRSLLRAIDLFREVEPDTIFDLLSQCDRMDIEKGELLLSPERPNQSVYIVLSGRLEVHLGSLESAKIANLEPGACTGEMSLVEQRDPSAYVVATEDSHLMVVSGDLLWQMVDRSHRLAKNLLAILSERVRSANEFIAERLGVLRQAERNAITDALTGLGNRHWMQDMFERELTRVRTDQGNLCLMMADVDRFKDINDKLGHIIGDRILAAIADAFRERLRPSDLIARFGGDEFAVLLPGVTLAEATATAERLRESLSTYSDPSLPSGVTLSIGLTEANESDDLDRLLQRADSAMYDAKDQGRNRVAIREAQS